MKLMFASLDVVDWKNVSDIAHYCKYMLVSFWYMQKNKNEDLYKLIQKRNEEDNFILDSGAFTLMTTTNKSKHDNLDKYISDYIAFVKKYKIKRYIEMDLDVVIGYEKVLEIREHLETEIGYPCMPVWHMSRGTDEFKKMCRDYDYVAIGGMGNGEIASKNFPVLKEMTAYARKQGTKVHGLAFTGQDSYKYGFYSVDSSSWRSGSRFGTAVKFQNNKLQAIKKPDNTRANYKIIDRNNFIEWCKFQRYVEGKGIV